MNLSKIVNKNWLFILELMSVVFFFKVLTFLILEVDSKWHGHLEKIIKRKQLVNFKHTDHGYILWKQTMILVLSRKYEESAKTWC